ncbi:MULTISPECIES: TolC family protein [unclassified Arcicella]|uniref:TolC family protein n=1 Tax=unclassified Arcicella TaxID=2644986 RepID=UPI00285BE274|nr:MULTISPECIES: TolC family protein [unclassified Arcicella]MDR6560121.1 outer membrane protein TolC [Arcicella sp. BE51]MDR6810272.1 outer membrane protein TolC [Arcicella sp. BE140]MDR6821622.1 outer membrane protein TolC [Arcicella sp. BE139]
MKTRKLLFYLWLALSGFSTQAQKVMTLKECIAFTLKNHISNSIYDNEIAIAKEKSREALAGYLPQVNTTITFDDNLKRQVSVIPAGAFSPTEIRLQFGNQYNTNGTAQVDQVIFDKSMLVGIKAAEPNNQVSLLKREQNQDNLIYSTTGAYFQVLVYVEQEKILLENEKKYRELLGILKLRLDKGVIKKTEYDRTQVSLNNILSQKSILQANKQVAINKLKNAMGMPLNEPLNVSEIGNYESFVAVSPENTADITNLLDYRIQQNNILLQEFDVKRKHAAYLPTVSAYARYGVMAFGNEINQSFKNWIDFSAIGLKVNVPIFSGYRKSSQVQQAELTLQNARANLKINTNTMDMQFQNANAQLQKSSSDLATNRENLNLAKEVYDNSELEYQKGVATLSDLLNSDYSYKEAQSNYVTSLINFLSSRLEYEKSKGTLKSYISQF